VKKIKIILLIIALVIMFWGLTLVPGNITVKSIKCSSQFGSCNRAILEYIKDFEYKDLKSVKKGLDLYLAENALILKYTIQFKFPGEVYVDVIERKPEFAIIRKDFGDIWLVDGDGYVMSKASSSVLPTLELEREPLNQGEFLRQEEIFSLSILKDMYSLYNLNYAKMDSESLEFVIGDNLKVFFPLCGERSVLIGSLIAILNQLNTGSEESRIEYTGEISVIDLRFKNPVIR